MAAAWPVANLPDYLLEDAASGSFGDNRLRSKMDVGPAKMRRRSTAAPDTFTGSQKLTSAQLGYLETFYKTTLTDGSLPFTWKHPRTRSTVDMRFLSPPTWSPSGGDYWLVNYSLEILP
jgi:hypothetical protein